MPSRPHYGDVLQLRPDLWRVPFAMSRLEHVVSYALVAERIGRREVELHGAWFDVERADLHVWSAASCEWTKT